MSGIFFLPGRRVLRPSVVWFIAALISILSVPKFCAAYQDEPVTIAGSAERTWKSLDGRFSVTGVLLEVNGDTIRIRTTDGKTISALKKKLSLADNEFVAAEIARVSEDNPFKMEGNDETPAGDSSFAGASGEMEADISAIGMIGLESDKPVDPESPAWKTSSPDFAAFGIPLETIHVRMKKGRISSDSKLFLAMMENPFGSGYFSIEPKVKNWIEIWSLANGKLVGRYAIPGEHTEVSDIDPAGKILLGYDTVFAPEHRIRLYRIDKDQLSPIASWNAKSANDIHRPRIEDARFLADGKMVVQESGSLITWDAKSAKALFRLELEGNSWRLAADQRTALLSGEAGRFEVDLIAGKTLASSRKALAADVVSPNGKNAVEFNGQTVTLRDVQGNVTDEFFIPVSWPRAIVTWVDDQTIRIALPYSTVFVDIPHRVAMLELTGVGSSVHPFGEAFTQEPVRGQSGSGIRISPVSESKSGLPAVDLESWRRRLPDPESLLLLKEGDRVSLAIDFKAEQQTAGLAESKVREILESRGVVIDPGAPDKLVIETTESTEQVEYKRFGAPPWSNEGLETVTVRRVNRTIKLERNGKVVWSVYGGTGMAAPILMLAEGETAQQAVDRQMGQPEAFWNSLSFPKSIASHPGGRAWATEQAR